MLKNQEIQRLFTLTDNHGNRLTCDIHLHLYLSLVTETRTRNIGRVYALPDGELIYEKHDDEKHVFKKNNSWSIHYEILKRVNYVKVMTRKCKYWIKTEDAMSRGTFLHFRDQGMEKKKYIPLKFWFEQEYNTVGANSSTGEGVRA